MQLSPLEQWWVPKKAHCLRVGYDNTPAREYRMQELS